MSGTAECSWAIDGDPVLARVSVRGELDMVPAAALRDECDERVPTGVRTVVADLTQLDFMDSSGLNWLLHLSKTCARDGAELVVLVTPGEAVERTIELTGLRPFFRLVADDPSAGDSTGAT